MPTSPYAPCIPTRGTAVPAHPDWIHEVKQDGFRLIVQRDNDRVRLFTRNGYDWCKRYPLIVEAARRIRTKQFVIDGEAVLLAVDGISDFDGLYGGRQRTMKPSFTPSTSSPLMAMICGSFPCTCARLTSPASSPVVLTASTWRPSSRAGSGRTFSRLPAT
jgi:bifunctional non-homologous end joining protein LigD